MNMKMKDTTRTRMTGYLGIAVATLLTPSGKLISSAVAAATVAGLVSMSVPPKPATVSMSAPPVVYTGAEYLDSELLNPGQLPGTEIGSDTSVTEETNGMLKLASVASINVAATDSASNGSSGGGLPETLSFGPGSGPSFPGEPDDPKLPVLPQPDPKPTECITLYSGSLKTTGMEDTESTDNNSEGCKPPVIVLNTPPETDEPTVPGKPPYIPPEVNDLPEDVLPTIPASFPPGTPGDQPTSEQLILPFVTVAAIPEPSTLGLLLLGVIGFGWVHRRKNKA